MKDRSYARDSFDTSPEALEDEPLIDETEFQPDGPSRTYENSMDASTALADPQGRRELSGIVAMPPITTTPHVTFKQIAKWEGIVSCVDDKTFTAELHDMVGEDPPKIAEFDFEEVPFDSRVLVKPGAIFYWAIGYNVSKSGQHERVSSIYFRRLPAQIREDRQELVERAADLAAKLGW